MIDKLKFDTASLIPVVTQDANTKEVLMLAYANREAIESSLGTGQAHYYSRSRQEIWHKGATSGNVQYIQDIYYDCDNDALLYLVLPKGPACHTDNYSCFYRSLTNAAPKAQAEANMLSKLQETINKRRENPKEGSYTNYLLNQGLDKILKKVGEENAELIIAAKNNVKQEILNESADLIYHISVLLSATDISWPEILEELQKRSDNNS